MYCIVRLFICLCGYSIVCIFVYLRSCLFVYEFVCCVAYVECGFKRPLWRRLESQRRIDSAWRRVGWNLTVTVVVVILDLFGKSIKLCKQFLCEYINDQWTKHRSVWLPRNSPLAAQTLIPNFKHKLNRAWNALRSWKNQLVLHSRVLVPHLVVQAVFLVCINQCMIVLSFDLLVAHLIHYIGTHSSGLSTDVID